MIAIQGLMSVRACALYENSKRVVILLGSTFVITQLLTISTAIVSSLPPFIFPSQEGFLLGVRRCFTIAPSWLPSWIGILTNGSACAYDIVLAAILVYRSVMYLRERRKQNHPMRSTGLLEVLIGQGLLYFVWAIACQAVSTAGLLPSTLPTNVAVLFVWNGITLALQTGLLSMLGPWMIISIRQNHMNQLNGGSGGTGYRTVSAVVFGEHNSALGELDASGSGEHLQAEHGEP